MTAPNEPNRSRPDGPDRGRLIDLLAGSEHTLTLSDLRECLGIDDSSPEPRAFLLELTGLRAQLREHLRAGRLDAVGASRADRWVRPDIDAAESLLRGFRDLDHASFVEGPATPDRAYRLLAAAFSRAAIVVGLMQKFHLPVEGPSELGLLAAEAVCLTRRDNRPGGHRRALAAAVFRWLYRTGAAAQLALPRRPRLGSDAESVSHALRPLVRAAAENDRAGAIILRACPALPPGHPIAVAPLRLRHALLHELPEQLLGEEPEATADLLLLASQMAGDLFLPPPPRPRWSREERRLCLGTELVTEYARDNAPGQFAILDAFETAGWTRSILRPEIDGELEDALRHLQVRLKGKPLTISRDGTGRGLSWAYAR